jgi:cytochrome c5
MTRIAVSMLLALAVPLAACAADVKTITLPPDNAYGKLKDGPGRDVTQTQCQFCHSTDYIVMQPRGDAKQWDAVVTKMIKVFGAPINEPDAKAITEYLATAYGPAK